MSNPESSPEVIMFIRHGEKPADDGPPHGVNEHGEHDPHALSVRGWTRAGALAALFANAPSAMHPNIVQPVRVIATRASDEAKSRREVDTARPTADRLGVALEDSHSHGDEKEVATEILAKPDSALVVWHHGALAQLVGHFPVSNAGDVPGHWPEKRFDLIWVLVREPGDQLAYRFIVVAQGLLVDDVGDESL
jgi:broad specificity phosphatase PhoE